MSWEDLAAKFRDCASYSVKPLASSNIEKAIELITKLEEVNNIGEIIELIT